MGGAGCCAASISIDAARLAHRSNRGSDGGHHQTPMGIAKPLREVAGCVGPTAGGKPAAYGTSMLRLGSGSSYVSGDLPLAPPAQRTHAGEYG
jgi:hypothetical protein